MSNQQQQALKPSTFYDAKPVSWRADVTDNGKVYVAVKFDIGLWWRGWLEGKAIQFTVDALHAMGFKGANPNDLNTNPNALNKNAVVGALVDWMKNADGTFYVDKKNGQKRLEVAGVWPQGGAKKEISAQATTTLQSIDLRAYLAESEKTNPNVQKVKETQDSQKQPQQGSQGTNQGQHQPQTDPAYASDDIPF